MADSSSSFGWLVAWLAGSAGSGSSSGSSSNSQNSQTGVSPSSPAAAYIGNNHATTPTAPSRRYDSSTNGLYRSTPLTLFYLLFLCVQLSILCRVPLPSNFAARFLFSFLGWSPASIDLSFFFSFLPVAVFTDASLVEEYYDSKLGNLGLDTSLLNIVD